MGIWTMGWQEGAHVGKRDGRSRCNGNMTFLIKCLTGTWTVTFYNAPAFVKFDRQANDLMRQLCGVGMVTCLAPIAPIK